MNAIEAYIQFKPGLFTDEGEVTDPGTEQFLRDYLEEFDQFIARVLQVLPPDED
jgi:chromate reductase